MGLNLAVDCMCGEDPDDDWSLRLGENTSEYTLKYLVAKPAKSKVQNHNHIHSFCLETKRGDVRRPRLVKNYEVQISSQLNRISIHGRHEPLLKLCLKLNITYYDWSLTSKFCQPHSFFASNTFV